jgi:hypothetical protein
MNGRIGITTMNKKGKKTRTPLYAPQYATRREVTSSQEYRRRRRKEQKFWILGGVLIGIAFIGGMVAIIWVAAY